jgi:hypothetical protein
MGQPELPTSLERAELLYVALCEKMGEDRFRPSVLVGAIRVEAVAAGARGRID